MQQRSQAQCHAHARSQAGHHVWPTTHFPLAAPAAADQAHAQEVAVVDSRTVAVDTARVARSQEVTVVASSARAIARHHARVGLAAVVVQRQHLRIWQRRHQHQV